MTARNAAAASPTAAARRRRLADVRRADRGPAVAALFDFDGTLVAGYSVFAFLQEKLLQGQMRLEEVTGMLAVMGRFAAGRVDFGRLVAEGARHARGVEEQRYVGLGERSFEKHLAARLFPEARELVQAHRDRGHTIAIVSSATPYQIAPAARVLGIEHLLCTRFAVRAGRFTGELDGVPCHGPGKLAAAQALAAGLGIDLDRSFFYSDSHEDLPLLERVGRPRPVNPDRELQTLARARRWPVRRFAARPVASPVDYLRGMSPFPILAASIVAGLPMLLLTRSVRETANFVVGVFGDIASATAGLKLDVRGERNLWLARPCIFVFNHQSNADVFIIARLVRRDITGIAKQELRRVPLLGGLVELGGLVFVDRDRTKDAVRAMQPLVDAVRRDGKSVCIAPEGTRSVTGALGPFKKGAFHLAIQTRAPVVPVVIHNSRDVQAKHELAMHPATVRVDVLAPIDTSGWRASSLDAHVAAVRGMFLDRLGQRETAAAVVVASRPARRHGRRVE
jgi:putative phosphoserine phosphatase/1-acylglycerol-3-phosphate O-acyltransferase